MRFRLHPGFRRALKPVSNFAVIVLTGAAVSGFADEGHPILLTDFEAATYRDWETTGSSFGPGPVSRSSLEKNPVDGCRGSRFAGNHQADAASTGQLTSPTFPLQRRFITFLIGGRHAPGELCANLVVNDRIVRSATGLNRHTDDPEVLVPYVWDVADLSGADAFIRIVDKQDSGWGTISVDHFVMTDTAPDVSSVRDSALVAAHQAVAGEVARANDDSSRPVFHFRPPAQWMNDPNGTIWHNGYCHVFYQHNPYGDSWGNMHWGHTRSKDLVHWEHLPISLWPSLNLGEEHVFSGCAWHDSDHHVRLFYTSVGPDRPNEQWTAVARDDDLLEWDKPSSNPLITVTQPDGLVFSDGMRDPFIFVEDGRTFMVVGASTENEAVIPIYEAEDDQLSKWSYRGIMWRAPKSVIRFPECPNFFRLGDHWILLLSPYRPVEYRTGRFDLESLTFQPEHQGLIDATDRFYATNIAFDDNGRCNLFGWIRGFPENKGWNGCLALPRELTIGSDGHPRQRPVRELTKLRGTHFSRKDVRLSSEEPITCPETGGSLEIRTELDPGTAQSCGIRLLRSAEGKRSTLISFDGNSLTVAGDSVPLPASAVGRPLSLHLFLDRSVLEVFTADGRMCITRVIEDTTDTCRIELFAADGTAQIRSFEMWSMNAVWNDHNSRLAE